MSGSKRPLAPHLLQARRRAAQGGGESKSGPRRSSRARVAPAPWGQTVLPGHSAAQQASQRHGAPWASAQVGATSSPRRPFRCAPVRSKKPMARPLPLPRGRCQAEAPPQGAARISRRGCGTTWRGRRPPSGGEELQDNRLPARRHRERTSELHAESCAGNGPCRPPAAGREGRAEAGHAPAVQQTATTGCPAVCCCR